MVVAVPLLQQLKRDKKSSIKEILRPHVDEWLNEHSSRLDVYTEEDFEFLKRLTVVGTTRDAQVFSPSGATSCQRFQVINKTPSFKRAENINPALIKIFDDGKWRHLKWQMLFWKMGIVDDAETFKSNGPLTYGGSFDLILSLPWIKEKGLSQIILDIKGINASGFNYIKMTGKPKFAHKLQVIIYMYLHGIRRAVIWYENKNTQEICEVVVDYDERLLEIALRRQKTMESYVGNVAFPKEECDVGDSKDSMFRQCPQRLNCPRLPIHFIKENGKVVKTHEPRIEDKDFSKYNKLKLAKTSGKMNERKRRLKGDS